MPEKIAFSQYVPAAHSLNNLTACRDEIAREIATRKRLYDRWVAEGKCTWTEADTRLRSLMGAMLFLDQHVEPDAQIKLELQQQPF